MKIFTPLSLIAPLLISANLYSDELPEVLKPFFSASTVGSVKKHEGTGLLKVTLGTGAKYLVTEKGDYIIKGTMLKVEDGKIIDEEEREARDTIADHNKELYITYPAKGEEVGSAYVIADIACHYCALLHKEVDQLNEKGVSVHFIPFPGGGMTSPAADLNRRVWCSTDPVSAMDYGYKHHGSLPNNLTYRDGCNLDLIRSGFDLGRDLNVSGTPTIYLSNGSVIPGTASAEIIYSTLKRKR